MTVGAAWGSRPAWQAASTRTWQAEAGAVQAALDAAPMPGRCALCGRDAGFEAAASPAAMREGLACLHCRCNARQRAAAQVLLAALPSPATARVYATEQASPFFVALRRRVGALTGSEFRPGWRKRLRLSAWLLRQGVAAWVRDGDLTALRRADASVDAIVSLDVLEHVPDYRAALRECARVLRPGGVLVLTVPFYDDRDTNEQIAWLRADGAVEHAGEPEYHGDPISGGVLCFHHFGWALLDEITRAGFRDVTACRVHGPAGGVPQGVWVLSAFR